MNRPLGAALAAAALVFVGLAAAPPASAAAPVVTVTPDTGLVSGQVVTLEGTGFTPDTPVRVGQCATWEDCDFPWRWPMADGSGHFVTAFTVQRMLPQTHYFEITAAPAQGLRDGDTIAVDVPRLALSDCATVPGGCFLMAHSDPIVGEPVGASATIGFDAAAPVPDRVYEVAQGIGEQAIASEDPLMWADWTFAPDVGAAAAPVVIDPTAGPVSAPLVVHSRVTTAGWTGQADAPPGYEWDCGSVFDATCRVALLWYDAGVLVNWKMAGPTLEFPSVVQVDPPDSGGLATARGWGFDPGTTLSLEQCTEGPTAESPRCAPVGRADVDAAGEFATTVQLSRLLYDGSQLSVAVTPDRSVIDGQLVAVHIEGLPAAETATDCASGCWLAAFGDGEAAFVELEGLGVVDVPSMSVRVGQVVTEGPNDPTPDWYWLSFDGSTVLGIGLDEVADDGTFDWGSQAQRLVSAARWTDLSTPVAWDCADPALDPDDVHAQAVCGYAVELTRSDVDDIAFAVAPVGFVSRGPQVTVDPYAWIASGTHRVTVTGKVLCAASTTHVHIEGVLTQSGRRSSAQAVFRTDLANCSGTMSWTAVAYPTTKAFLSSGSAGLAGQVTAAGLLDGTLSPSTVTLRTTAKK